MVMLVPRSPRFTVNVAYGSDDGWAYPGQNEHFNVFSNVGETSVTHNISMCSAYAPNLATFPSASALNPTAWGSVGATWSTIPASNWGWDSTTSVLEFNLNSVANKPFWGGVIIVRCHDRSRRTVNTEWAGNPWRPLPVAGFPWAWQNAAADVFLGSVFQRIMPYYLFTEGAWTSHDLDSSEPMATDYFTFHIPTAVTTRAGALAFIAANGSSAWPPRGRYHTFIKQSDEALFRHSVLPSHYYSPAAAVAAPVPTTAHRVTLVISRAGGMWLDGSLPDSSSWYGNQWVPLGSTVAQIALLLECASDWNDSSWTAPKYTNIENVDAIDHTSITVTCVAPAPEIADMPITVTDLDTANYEIHKLVSRLASSSSSSSWSHPDAATVVIGNGISAARGLGACVSAHVSFTVQSRAPFSDGGAVGTYWRARAVVSTHYGLLRVSKREINLTPRFQFHAAEALPVYVSAPYAAGALYTADSLRLTATATSAASTSDARPLIVDIPSLNMSLFHDVTVRLPPALADTLNITSCTLRGHSSATGYDSTERFSTLTPQANFQLISAPLHSVLSFIVPNFGVAGATADVRKTRGTARVTCLMLFASTAAARLPRAVVEGVVTIKNDLMRETLQMTVRFPPVVSRHLRTVSKYSETTAISWPPDVWTGADAEAAAWLEMRLTDEAGRIDDADVASALSPEVYLYGGISIAESTALYARWDAIRLNSTNTRRLLLPTVVTLPSEEKPVAYSAKLASTTGLPFPLQSEIFAIQTPQPANELIGFTTPGSESAYFPLLEATSGLLTCGMGNCTLSARFMVKPASASTASCGPITEIDPNLALGATL